MTRSIAWLSLLAPVFALAAPSTQQFVNGIDAIPTSSRPLVQVTLPDDVYRTITRADLADLLVFDRDGAVVPHAFCPSPERTEPVVSTIDLPVIELQGTSPKGTSGAQIDVRTPDGSHIAVHERGSNGAVSTQAHVIDATVASKALLRAIDFDWQTADGSSEARVRIDASDDLDTWQTVVAATTLLKAGRDGELRRERVGLPLRSYRYLRVARVDRGSPIVINAVRAEQVTAARAIEPTWFVATPLGREQNALSFNTERRAPVQFARLQLPFENMTVQVTVQSRPNDSSPWITRWRGEMYSVVVNGGRKTSDGAAFAATSDTQWRVQFASEPPGSLLLELGYRPALLQFVTQGTGPFTIAYGSRQITTPSARECGQLLGDVAAEQRRDLTGEAELTSMRMLGGKDALRPLPRKTPLRLVVLWGVLIAGVATLVAMALSLLKRVKPTQ